MTSIPLDPEQTQQIEDQTNAIERQSGAVGSLNMRIEKWIENMNNLPKEVGREVRDSLQKIQSEYSKTNDAVDKVRDNVGRGFDVSSIMNLARKGIGPALEDISKYFSKLTHDMERFRDNADKQFGDVGGAAKSLASIGFAKLREEAVGALDAIHYTDIQKSLYEIRERALQTGIAFGESFVDAEKSAEGFNVSLSKTISSTKATAQEVLETRDAFKNAFSARETFDAITSLQTGITGVKSAIDVTNVALTVAKATGTGHTEVAKMMADAHLELGATIEESALAMAHISDAAKDSGLHFKNVGENIVGAAKSLKYYGTSIESVSPLFKSFNQSMKGIGREGLTPELLTKFVNGIKGMTLSTRALLGLSAPGGMARGGILGGGLKMEEAVAKGDFGAIAKSISETMKRYAGGGEVLTRQEAVEQGRERDYIIQRQILGKLTGIADPAEANMMMQALKDIDKHGMDAGSDSVSTLEKLMSSGEEVAEKTTTDLKKAQLDFYTTSKDQGGELIDIGKRMLDKFDTIGVRDFAQKILSISERVASGGIGEVDLKTIGSSIQSLENQEAELASQLENLNLTEKQKKTIEGKLGSVKTEKTKQQITAEYKEGIIKALREGTQEQKQQYARTGVAPEEIHRQVWDQVTAKLDNTQFKALRGLEKTITKEDKTEKATGVKDKEYREAYTLTAAREAAERQRMRAQEIDFEIPGAKDYTDVADLRRKLEENSLSTIGQANIASTREIRAAQEQMSAVKKRQRHEEDMAAAPKVQEVNGKILIQLELDSEGRILTKEQMVEIVDGRIRGESLGVGKK